VFGILPQLDILCTSAMKRHYARKDNLPFKCHLFSRALEFMEARKLATEWFGPQSGQLVTLEIFAIKIVSSRLPRR